MHVYCTTFQQICNNFLKIERKKFAKEIARKQKQAQNGNCAYALLLANYTKDQRTCVHIEIIILFVTCWFISTNRNQQTITLYDVYLREMKLFNL